MSEKKRPQHPDSALEHSIRGCNHMRFSLDPNPNSLIGRKEQGARWCWIQLSPGYSATGKRSHNWGKAVVVASPHPFPPYENNTGGKRWFANFPLNWATMRWALTKDRTRLRMTSNGPLPWTRVDEASKQSQGAGKVGWVGGESAVWGEGENSYEGATWPPPE